MINKILKVLLQLFIVVLKLYVHIDIYYNMSKNDKTISQYKLRIVSSNLQN